jgi:hypothetical protein
MRVLRAKQIRKYLKFYKIVFEIDAPYHVCLIYLLIPFYCNLIALMLVDHFRWKFYLFCLEK